MTLSVSRHAVDRAIERLGMSEAEAITFLSSPKMQAAADFGARYVKLGTGHRVVIEHGSVVTVTPPTTWLGTLGSSMDAKRLAQRNHKG